MTDLYQNGASECVGSRQPIAEPTEDYNRRTAQCPECGCTVAVSRWGLTSRHGHRRPRNPDQPLLVRMTPDLHDAVRACAEAEDRSMASVVRQALRQYVEARPCTS